MIKIIKKEKDFYELVDEQNILGTINYTSGPTIKPVGFLAEANIIIKGNTYHIKHNIVPGNMLIFNHSVQLFNNLNEKISSFEYNDSSIKDSFNLGKVFIKLNETEYYFSVRSKVFRPLTSMFSSFFSSYGWFNSTKDKEYMYFKKTKGFLSTKEVTVQTQLSSNDLNAILLALWGFYLLPKTRNSLIFIIITLIVLFPILMVLFAYLFIY